MLPIIDYMMYSKGVDSRATLEKLISGLEDILQCGLAMQKKRPRWEVRRR
jgi:hypothetical protein